MTTLDTSPVTETGPVLDATIGAGDGALVRVPAGGRLRIVDLFGNQAADTVTGINVDLVPGRRIVQAWRHRRFPEGIFSMAAFTLKPTPDGGTELVLVHRGVPKDLIPETEQAWRDQYWSRIKAYLDREFPRLDRIIRARIVK